MPRLCRKHPRLMRPLFDRFLDLCVDFESGLELRGAEAADNGKRRPEERQARASQGRGTDDAPARDKDDDEDKETDDDGAGTDGPGEDDPDADPSGSGGALDLAEAIERLKESLEEEEPGSGGDGTTNDADDNDAENDRNGSKVGKKGELSLSLEDVDTSAGGEKDDNELRDLSDADRAHANDDSDDDSEEDRSLPISADDLAAARALMDRFRSEWSPAAEALSEADATFGDEIGDLTDGPRGFDQSLAVWKHKGWRNVRELRRKLESLRELRDLVRSLGRGGGRGPLRRAPAQVDRSGAPPGVVRSPLQPEETRGLGRSGDLGRMLPAEAALMARGWPRRGSESETGDDEDGDDEGTTRMVGGSRAARLLHLVRRAERGLMSYERGGWVDDEPSVVLDRLELRPAAELGPILLCLDTSGSMSGARETVAKALALECLRGAMRQRRRALVYAFSGPAQCLELELNSTDPSSLEKLLDFLSGGFDGGTDVDLPFALALDQLEVEGEGWNLADVLLVTDGEIPRASTDLLERLARAKQDVGLDVHALLVGSRVTPAVEELCTEGCLHVFKSWRAAEGRGG